MLVFDFEVFKYDWMVTFKDVTTQEYTVIVNDLPKLRDFYERNKSVLHIGFNNKRYDNLIYRSLLDGANPYTVNNMIIVENDLLGVYQMWDIFKYWYPSMDISQDTQRGSLKEFEGYMGLNIDETTVPFNIDRKLTESEIQEVIDYCKADVDATEKYIELNTYALENKMTIVNEFDLQLKDLDKTNAQLVAEVLGANEQDFGDEFKPFPFENHTLTLPEHTGTVMRNGKPHRESTIYDFYNKAPNYNERLEINILGVPHILAYGGLHGAIPTYQYEGEIWLLDAKQYYPNIMIQFDYLSRAVPEEMRPLYAEIVANRDIMRDKGEYARAESYKLISNTTFGASKAKFNPMYDPHNANNICISGQLMLIDMIYNIKDYITLIQSNTDGIMVIPHDKDKIMQEVENWENRHNLKMDIEIFKAVYQKDVNNYIAVGEDESITVKGGYVAQTTINGHKPFDLRRTEKVVDDAVVNYFVNNVPVEETVYGCDDVLDFQMIRKTGRTFDGTVWEVNGKDIPVQKVNRVFPSFNTNYGKLYKVDDTRRHAVPSLPDNCLVANDSLPNLDEIDKTWYIERAYKRIEDFRG